MRSVNGIVVGGQITAVDELPVIEIEHNFIHQQRSWYAEVVDSIMADTDVLEMVLAFNSYARQPHIVYGAGVSNAVTLQLYRECVTQAPNNDGTLIANKPRGGRGVSVLVVTHTPSLSSDGTLCQTKFAGDGGKFSGAEIEVRGINEWRLDRGVKYLLRLTAHGDLRARLFINWYDREI